MTSSIKEELAALYAAAGYEVSASDPRPDRLELARRDAEGVKHIVLLLPFEAAEPPAADGVLAELTALAVSAPAALRVLALPKSTSLGAGFQSKAKTAGAELRNYAALLDGVYGGGWIGLGAGRGRAERLRRELRDFGRVDAELLSAVLRGREAPKALAAQPNRARQRFFLRDGPRPQDRRPGQGEDLLAHLAERFAQPPHGPEVHLVIGAGGAGKTFLFEGLFTYLDEGFQLRKIQQQRGVRPVPIMPASLLKAGARSGVDLLSSAAATEYGAVGGLGVLTHLTRIGANLPMFDGLDEYFAETEDLADSLQSAFLGEGARSRIVIVLRDSLLETSPAVRRMAERFSAALGPERFAIYELALWGAAGDGGAADGFWSEGAAQRELAWLKLEGRRPAPGEPDTDRVAGFQALLEGAPQLKDLSRLAFYCDLLIDLYKDLRAGAVIESRSGRPTPEDEYDVFDLCFEAILDRELAKQRPGDASAPVRAFLRAGRPDDPDPLLAALRAAAPEDGFEDPGQALAMALDALSASDGPPQDGPTQDGPTQDADSAWARRGLIELIETAAYFARRRPDATDLTPDRLRGLYEAAGFEATGDDQALGHRMLRQFVLFVQSGEEGAVDFAHEFMADYLAARRVVALARAGRGDLEALIGSPAAGETAVFRGYIARELGGGAG